jgi:hypothetical protein
MNPRRVISALSFNDIEHLHRHLLLIQLNALSIGEHQGLQPVRRRVPRLGMALDKVTDDYVVRRSPAYLPIEDSPEFDLKKEQLTNMLSQFERKVGSLLSVIKVKRLSIEDRDRMEDIDTSLRALRPLFQNAGVP